MNTKSLKTRLNQLRRQQQNKPMRRCIACYKSFPQEELIRFTLDDNILIPDTSLKKDGRGVYICKNMDCLSQAIKKKAFNRAFKMLVDIDTNMEVIENIINNTKED